MKSYETDIGSVSIAFNDWTAAYLFNREGGRPRLAGHETVLALIRVHVHVLVVRAPTWVWPCRRALKVGVCHLLSQLSVKFCQGSCTERRREKDRLWEEGKGWEDREEDEWTDAEQLNGN